MHISVGQPTCFGSHYLGASNGAKEVAVSISETNFITIFR